MSTRTKTLAIVGTLAFVGYLFYSTMSLNVVSCDVCIEFKGRTLCRTASGVTREEAQRTATDVACALLATTRTEGMACSKTPPKSIECR